MMKCFDCFIELKQEEDVKDGLFCPNCFAHFDKNGKCESVGFEKKQLLGEK